MENTDSFANVDTATLEAALEAAATGSEVSTPPAAPQAEAEPQPASPAPETADAPAAEDNSPEPPEAGEPEPTETLDENSEESPASEGEEEPAAEDDGEELTNEEPAEEEATEEAEPETYDPRAGWQDYERLASEIRERNPDILLDTALAMAKARLGYDLPPEQPAGEQEPEGDPEPTIAEKIEALEAALEEEGANEGLFTSRIAEMTKELSRLRSEESMQNMQAYMQESREADQSAREAAIYREQLLAGMAESRARVLDICPQAGDANTPIGRAMSQLIEQYQASNHPDLSAPNAPELIFSKANILLPPEARVSVTPRREPPKHQPKAPAAQPKPTVQKTSAAPPLPTAPPVPTARALPVAAGARTAQPDMSTLNPAQMGQMVRDASQEDLAAIEEALYGMSGRDVLLRI
jgi:hypothetical protein